MEIAKVECVEVTKGHERYFTLGKLYDRELEPESGHCGDLYLIDGWVMEDCGLVVRHSYGNALTPIVARFKEVGQ